MFSFQNVWPIKRKAVHTLVLFHILIHFLVRIGSQLVTTYFILVNLQAVAVGENCCFTEKSGGNFCRLPPDKGNNVALTVSLKGIFILIDLVTVFDAILTSRQTREKLQ